MLQNCSKLNALSGGVLKPSGMTSPAGNYPVDSIMAGGSERKASEREYIIPVEEDSDDDNDVEEIAAETQTTHPCLAGFNSSPSRALSSVVEG